MTANLNKLNTLVLAFFAESGFDGIEEHWNDAGFQKKLKALFSGAVRAAQKKRDPHAPKRGKSAYLFFCDAHRENVKRDLGEEAKATEITAQLGKRWKALLANGSGKAKAELAKYTEQAEADKSRYEQAKANYVPSDDFAEDSKGRRKKVAKTGPKRAKSSYLFFCEDTRAKIKEEFPEMSAIDVTTELGKRWNALKAKGDKATKKYVDLAATDKARYEREKASAGTSSGTAPATQSKTQSKATPKAATSKGKAPAKGKGKAPAPAPAPVQIEEEEELLEDDIIEDVVEQAPPAQPKQSKSNKGGKGKGKGKGK